MEGRSNTYGGEKKGFHTTKSHNLALWFSLNSKTTDKRNPTHHQCNLLTLDHWTQTLSEGIRSTEQQPMQC